MSKPKPEVGQILYRLNIGNAVSRFRPQELTEVVVKKVGRKYFYVGEKDCPEHMNRKYYLKNWEHENGGYSATSELFASKQEYFDKEEAFRISGKLRSAFGGLHSTRLTLESLKKIEAILDAEDEK